MLKIILVEDHQVMLAAMIALMKTDKQINVVAQAASGAELLELLKRGVSCDLILSDITMPLMDGISMLDSLKKQGFGIPVLLLSMHEQESYSSRAFIAGAAGYLSKNVNLDELLFAIKHVASGKRYFSSELCIQILEKYHHQLVNATGNLSNRLDLSERELSVLKLIADGSTNQQIADQIFLSRRTVEGIRQSLINRTGVKNTAMLIRFAISNGYIN